MAEIIQGMFGVSPELFKQREEEKAQAKALALAQLDPQQMAMYQAQMSGRGLGRAIGNLLGAEDPALARQSAENALFQQVQSSLTEEELTDPLKLNTAIFNAARQANMPEVAQHAYENIQAAKGLSLTQGKTLAEIDTQKSLVVKNLREAMPKIQQLTLALANATDDTMKANLQLAINKETELALPSIENRIVTLSDLKANGKITPTQQQELDYLDDFKKKVAKAGASNIEVSATSMRKEEGKGVGAKLVDIPTALSALDALNGGLSQLDLGINAGMYGNIKQTLTKASLGTIGSEAKVTNTEVYLAYIGNTVIPLMSKLGGSDSNEELNYMKRLVAGDVTLEPASMRRIITNAINAINRDIARTKNQESAVLGGKEMPVDRAPDIPRKTTRVWNPKTGDFEAVK
jgi:hypothetical protein